LIKLALAIFYASNQDTSEDFFNRIDPFLPLALLQTGQSAKSRFWELEGYKAIIGDLIQRPNAADRLALSEWQVDALNWWLNI
jgi:hypothetical protein